MRRRLTWEEDGPGKRASEIPKATPNEGAASPAHQPEKGAASYSIDSDFGSEPHSGPYGNGEHSATPDEGAASPAHKAAALERKAAKCIRLASAMLGEGATVVEVEDQALTFMDLSDRALHASLQRLADDDDDDDDDEEEVEEVEVEEGKKKKASLASRIARIERILIRLAESEDPEGDGAKGSKDPRGEKDGAKGSEDPGEESKKKADSHMDEDMDEDDAAAAEGLEAKKKKAESKEKRHHDESEEYGGNKGDESESDKDFKGKKADDEEAQDDDEESKKAGWSPGHRAPGGWDPGSEEAMLEEMLVEEGMYGGNEGDDSESRRDYEGMGHDEIGHIVHSDEVGMDDEMMMLAKLFEKSADIPAGEDKKEKEDHEKGAVADDKDHIKKLEKDEKEDKKDLKKDEKKASRKPQPKKESTGATRLGGVTKSAKSELSDLSKLWDSAPDVSKFF